MRRWKVVKTTKHFNIGDILVLVQDDGTNCLEFKRCSDNFEAWVCLLDLVEIDDSGNILRTYHSGETLKNGTLVNVTMTKVEAIKRLHTIEAEAVELRKIISQRTIYNSSLLYVAIKNNIWYLLIDVDNNAYFKDLKTSDSGWSTEIRTGQQCLDNIEKYGFTIHTFDNRKEMLKFLVGVS